MTCVTSIFFICICILADIEDDEYLEPILEAAVAQAEVSVQVRALRWRCVRATCRVTGARECVVWCGWPCLLTVLHQE